MQVALLTRFNGVGYTFVLAGFLKIVTVGGLAASAPVDTARTAFGRASPYLMVPVGLGLCWVAKQVRTSNSSVAGGGDGAVVAAAVADAAAVVPWQVEQQTAQGAVYVRARKGRQRRKAGTQGSIHSSRLRGPAVTCACWLL